MILRRLSTSIRKQGWFAVIIETLIVVFGVFIGLQVNNWNNALGDRQSETQILRDVATDLLADIEGYYDQIENVQLRIATISYIFDSTPSAAVNELISSPEEIELWPTWAAPDEDALQTGSLEPNFNFEDYAAAAKESLWSTAITAKYAQRSGAAFDALVNSGELGIIRNKEIVRQLQNYQLVTMAIEKSQDVTLRPARDAATFVGHKFGLAAFGALDEGEFLRLIASEPELAATLQTQLGWATTHHVMLVAAEQSAQRLLEDIQTELGETTGDDGGASE